MSADEFIYCPQCGSDKIESTDYEEENEDGEYEIDEDGRQCADCNWEGDRRLLVCKD